MFHIKLICMVSFRNIWTGALTVYLQFIKNDSNKPYCCLWLIASLNHSIETSFNRCSWNTLSVLQEGSSGRKRSLLCLKYSCSRDAICARTGGTLSNWFREQSSILKSTEGKSLTNAFPKRHQLNQEQSDAYFSFRWLKGAGTSDCWRTDSVLRDCWDLPGCLVEPLICCWRHPLI